MFRFIKVFIVMYVFSLAFIITVADVSVLPNTARSIAIIVAISTLLWCWLKKPSRAS